MSGIRDLPEEIQHIPGVLRARVDWPEVDGPAVLEIALDPASDREATLERVLAALRDVAGVDLGSLWTGEAPVPPPPGTAELTPEQLAPPRADAAGSAGHEHAGPAATNGGPRPAAEPDGPGETDHDGARPAFRELRVERGATSLRVRVLLDWRGRVLSGETTSVATDRGGLQAVAQATLEAVAHLLPDAAEGHIEWADAGEFGHERVVTVGAALVSDRSQTRLVGGAVVHRDRWDATVRATLDAFNRQLVPRRPEGSAGAAPPPG